jgi:Spy/CpxP family protein refolding chaperone
LFVCLGLSLVFLLPAGDAAAQGYRWWKNEQYRKDLMLTEEQTVKLDAIYQATIPTLRQQNDELEKLDHKLSKLIAAGLAEEQKVAEQVDKVEAARSALSKTRTLMMYKMRRLLTDDQNAKLKEIHDRWEKERRSRGRSDREHGGPGHL